MVSDSQNYKKNTDAAREIERQLGLPPPPPVAEDKKVGNRRSVDQARRRAERKGEVFMNANELAQLMRAALAEAESPETFDQAMLNRGVELEWSRRGEDLVGLKLRPAGTTTWLSASSASRDLSCSKILAVLKRNAELRKELRAAAEAAAADVVVVADERARERVAARLERNAALDDVTAVAGVAVRTLPEPEANAARALAAAGPDPLEFLQPPVHAPCALDDTTIIGADDARVRRERADAQAELSEQFKQLSAAQLIELRNASKRPVDEALVALALLEQLLALALKWLSFGTIKVSTNISSALQQRELVAQAANDEIARRHRSPATAGERIKWLTEYQAAIGTRQVKISAAQTAADLAKLQPVSSGLREQLIARADTVRAEVGKPTSRQLKAEVKKREAVVAGLLAEAATSLARLRRLAASAEFKKRLARARQPHQKALDRLAHFLDAIEAEVKKREAAQAAQVAKDQKILEDEAEALAIEISDRVPALKREAEHDATRERLRSVSDAPAGSDLDKTRMRRG